MTVKKVLHLLTVLVNRKAEWERKPLIQWMKQTNETHIKQVLYMVLSRNWDSELYKLRNAIILFLGAPNIFTIAASLWGIISFLPAQY